MGANDHLQPNLFHVTPHELKGNRILPAYLAGKEPNYPDLSDPSKAYATSSEGTAWQIAGWATGGDQRGRVHRVSNPNAVMGEHNHSNPNRSYFADNLDEWTAPHFDIGEEVTAKPGRQATFPLNWKQFASGRGVGEAHHIEEDEYNHPTDSLIQQGHDLLLTQKEIKRASPPSAQERLERMRNRTRGQEGLF